MAEAAADRGHRMRQLRCIAGADQLDMAKALGFQSQSGLSLLENGKRKLTAEHIDAAADYLAPLIDEPREEIIGFLHGLRRFTLSPTAEAFPVIRGEGRDAKRAAKARTASSRRSSAPTACFAQTLSDQEKEVA